MDLKFDRARELLGQLEIEVNAFLQAGPFTIEQAIDTATGERVVTVRVKAQPPLAWSAVIGDVLHNARSALDQLAWGLVEHDGGIPDDYTCFPITNGPVGYGDKLRSGLKHASPATRDAVRALKPWQGGNDSLWRLHRLNIIDKHRLLVPVGAAHRGIQFVIDTDEGPRLADFEIVQSNRQFPLKDGDEILREQGPEVPAGFPVRQAVAFEVAFGDGEIVAGEPLFPTLRNIVEDAAATVEPLATDL